MTRYWLLAVLAFLCLGLAACGGGGGDRGAATPGATAELPSPAAGTPTEGFTITGNLFESQTSGYQVRFPEAWTPEPNFVSASDLSMDAFLAPDVVDGVQPNIAVICEQVPEGTVLKDYFDAKTAIEKQVTQVEPEVGSRQVSGQEALTSRYKRENIEAPLEKAEVFFISERCGWNISLTVPLSKASDYQDLFDEFLNSFRLLP
jgi:hypothetical protein